MLRRVDRDDALVGNQGVDETDWLAFVIFVGDHWVPPRFTLLEKRPIGYRGARREICDRLPVSGQTLPHCTLKWWGRGEKVLAATRKGTISGDLRRHQQDETPIGGTQYRLCIASRCGESAIQRIFAVVCFGERACHPLFSPDFSSGAFRVLDKKFVPLLEVSINRILCSFC